MNLKESVSNQVAFSGRTPGGCKLVLHDLLDNGRDVFQFMQLFNEQDIKNFAFRHTEEITTLCAEDDEILPAGASLKAMTKLALEKTLIIIEGEIKNDSHSN